MTMVDVLKNTANYIYVTEYILKSGACISSTQHVLISLSLVCTR